MEPTAENTVSPLKNHSLGFPFAAVIRAVLQTGNPTLENIRLLIRVPSTETHTAVLQELNRLQNACPENRCQFTVVVHSDSFHFRDTRLSSPRMPNSGPSKSGRVDSRSRRKNDASPRFDWQVLTNEFAPAFPEARWVVLSRSSNSRSKQEDAAYRKQEAVMEREIVSAVGIGYLGRRKFDAGKDKLALTYFKRLEDVSLWRAHAAHLRTKHASLPQKWYGEYEIMVAKIQDWYGLFIPNS